MSTTKLRDFLWKYREAVIHVCFWVFYLFMTEFALGTFWESFDKYFLRILFLTFPLVFYVNAFWLIPKCLKKKRWVVYIFAVLLLCLVIEVFKSIVVCIQEYETPLSVDFYSKFSATFFDEFSLLTPFLIYLGVSFAYRFTKDWIVNIGLVERLKAEKVSAELAFLKSQVDPHFLFNTLNSLYGLALEENSDKTAEGITKLGTLMRYNLHDSQAEFISLEKELDYIDKYIALQKLRLTERNTISFQTEINKEDINTLKIVPMLLIPFIENAFKHGLSPSEETFVDIKISSDEEKLILKVNNSLPQTNRRMEESGVGFKNAEDRLNLLYPNAHKLFAEEQTGVYVLHLEINLSK